jgi:hypothetical protein
LLKVFFKCPAQCSHLIVLKKNSMPRLANSQIFSGSLPETEPANRQKTSKTGMVMMRENIRLLIVVVVFLALLFAWIITPPRSASPAAGSPIPSPVRR